MADPREIAEQVIRAQTRNGKRGNIAAAVSQMTDLPSRAEFMALCGEVADLIPRAVITVTFPGDDAKVAVTRDALIDAISLCKVEGVQPIEGRVTISAESLADAILAVVGEGL